MSINKPFTAKPPLPSLLTQFIDLFLMEMTNWRWTWRTMVIIATISPLLSILALGVFARDSGLESLTYVLTGNVVLALMFGNSDKLQSHFYFMRSAGTLDYYATLPVQRQVLILAVVAAFFMLSLPSVIVTMLLGAYFLGITLMPHPLVVLIVPICSIPLAGIGALIGVTARNPQESGSLSLVVTLLLVGLGPVIIPPTRLPPIMVTLGWFSPATYAASALRQTLLGPITSWLIIDVAVLLTLGIAIYWLVGHKLDWRQR